MHNLETTTPSSTGSSVANRQLGLLDLPSVAELEACIRCGSVPLGLPDVQAHPHGNQVAAWPHRAGQEHGRGRARPARLRFAAHRPVPAVHGLPFRVSHRHQRRRNRRTYQIVQKRRLDAGHPGANCQALIYKQLLPYHGAWNSRRSRSGSTSGVGSAIVRRLSLTRLLPGPLRRWKNCCRPGSARRCASSRRPRFRPIGKERAELTFHLTCVNNVVLQEASAASLRVLARNGCAVWARREPSVAARRTRQWARWKSRDVWHGRTSPCTRHSATALWCAMPPRAARR